MKFGRKAEEPVEQPVEEKPKNTSVGININGNPEPEKKKSVFAKEKEIIDEDRIGTWADTGYKLSDAEAHRDVSYDGGSSIKRILGIFINQMKLFSKNKWTFILMFAAVLIPILILGVEDLANLMKNLSTGSTSYIGTLLCLMAPMVCFFTAVLCGTQIPNEFKERTAYMSLPLPVTRMEFYIGKYLAGFVLCLGIFLMAFGFATLMAMQEYDAFFSGDIASALLCTVVTIFMFSATSFCVGCFMKRGSTLLPLMLLLVILPVLSLVLYLVYDVNAVLMMPWLLPDAIVMTLGSGMTYSVMGLFSVLVDTTIITDNLSLMVALGVVWGIAFLALGAYKMNRREM